MLTGSVAFYTVAESLLLAVTVQLNGTTAGVPTRVGIMPGLIAWDDCECGQLAVNVTRLYDYDTFPEERTLTNVYCTAAGVAAEITVQVARCAPNPSNSDVSPSVEALRVSALGNIADAWEIQLAVICELQRLLDIRDISNFVVRDVITIGPEGGCVGAELHAVVGLIRL